MSRLWDRGEELHAAIERLTVGNDPHLDLALVPFDALASAAHATMLERIGVLQPAELAALVEELSSISEDAQQGAFSIEHVQEDGHTAIENRLTERLGEAGQKIHTGRSRNDQVIAALRLWAREMLLSQTVELIAVIAQLVELSDRYRETSLPGYSHTRQAMPSTLGFLFGAYAEGLLDSAPWLETAWRHVNRSPLGSASGFGVALPLDRQLVADLLAFDSVQNNTLAVQNDRGKTELLLIGAELAVSQEMGRLATDLIWLSTDELRAIRLDSATTTGSSIMPQKRNPDVLELIRAGAARVRAHHSQIGAITGELPAGYHRDLQLTKGPFLDGMQDLVDMLRALQPVLAGLEVDEDRCRALMRPEIGATDALYARVADGATFRTAYKEIALDPSSATSENPSEGWRERTHLGAPGSFDPRACEPRLAELRQWVESRSTAVSSAWNLLTSPPATD